MFDQLAIFDEQQVLEFGKPTLLDGVERLPTETESNGKNRAFTLLLLHRTQRAT